MGAGWQFRDDSRRGVSILELLIYVAVMATVGVPLTVLTVSVSRSSSEGDVLSKVLERNRSVLHTMVTEYRVSISGTTNVSNGGRTVQFTSNGGFNGMGAAPGPVIRYEIRPDPADPQNTRDDNQNGLVDESILVRVNGTTGQEVVLSAGLDTANCSFAQNGTGLTFTVTTAGRGRGASAPTTVQRSMTVFPRN